MGRLISERRRQSTMTQDELAAASGIDSSNIRAYETGRAMPSVHSVVRIATALGTEPGELLTGLTRDLFTGSEQAGSRAG